MENSKSDTHDGYGLVYQSVMRNKSLSIEAKAIYAYLSSFAGNKGECYPARKLILNDLHICGETFDKHIKQLLSYGYIEKKQVKNNGKFSKNTYKINHFVQNNEKPDTKKSNTKKSNTEKSNTEKSTTNNNSINNKNIYSSNEEYIQKGSPFCPSAEIVKNEFEDAETAQNNTLTIKQQIKEQRQRYDTEQLKLIDNFFDVLKCTRRGNKLADSVILKIYNSWSKYEVQKVIYGIDIYINNPSLHDKKENYVLGIIRNSTAAEINRGGMKNESNIRNRIQNIKGYGENGQFKTFEEYNEYRLKVIAERRARGEVFEDFDCEF